MTDAATPGGEPEYPVILLVEQALSEVDALQVRGLHLSMPELPHYTVLIPVEDAAGRVEASMGALGGGELMAPLALDAEDYREMQQEVLDSARRAVAESVAAIEAAGALAEGRVIAGDPIETLEAAVAELSAREVIVLTRPHVVAEFFRMDWSSRARRRLGVPVLHLLEHETFEEQSGGHGEGVSGF